MSTFTLIETLMVITIMAILIFFVLPINQSSLEKRQLDLTQARIITAVHYALATAMQEKKQLILAPIDANHNWSLGMALIEDNATHSVNDTALIREQWLFNIPGIQVYWRGFHGQHYIAFSNILKKATSNGTFEFLIRGEVQRKWLLNRIGYMHQEV